MTPPEGFAAALAALPEGCTTGRAGGSRYIATKTTFSGGKSVKLVAEELGGAEYISFNLYLPASGPRLFPCEMPAALVIGFLREFRPDTTPGD